jgi:hypothetical protein
VSELSLEAALLHLVIEGDLDTARQRVLTEMLSGEQHDLAEAAQQLATLCCEVGYIRRALADGCAWSRTCSDPAAAYYYNRRDQKRTIPHGICARHRPEAVENRFPVFDPPAEVKL